MGTEVNDTDTNCAVTSHAGTSHAGTNHAGTNPGIIRACHTASAGIGTPAGENRRMLGAALSAAGLVNYPSEWWHWSYGDRYWAFATKAGNACYGPV